MHRLLGQAALPPRLGGNVNLQFGAKVLGSFWVRAKCAKCPVSLTEAKTQLNYKNISSFYGRKPKNF